MPDERINAFPPMTAGRPSIRRRRRAEGRASRWDARPALTARDAAALRFVGEHYAVRGAKRGPEPAHDIGIWLGAYKPRMLRLTGRKADGWLPSLSYLAREELAPANTKTVKVRHHGDFHLGQVLMVKDDAFVLDFEGEPGRSLKERRGKAPAARDVAGLIRSIDYSTTAALERALERPGNRPPRAGLV